MKLSKINTSELKYNPTDIDFIQDLTRMPEFDPEVWPSKALDRKMVFTYIVIMYDMNCNLRTFFPNYWHRKRMAAEAAGFELNKGQFSSVVQQMLFGEFENINRMAIRYAVIFNEASYVALVSYYEMFVQETFESLKTTDSAEKKQLAANIFFFNKQIKELTETIFGGVEIEGFRRELYKTAISDLLDLRPELIAEKLQEGDQPTKTYYQSQELLDE